MQALINTEAELTVIAPTIIDEVRALTGEFPNKRKIEFIERDYQQGDELGSYMVIAATDLPELNNSIANRARDQMILANSVDEPDYCDFYVPSVVEAGDIKIAISTNAKAPAVAQRIRLELEPIARDIYQPILEYIAEFRSKVHTKITGKQAARRSKLIRWYSERVFKRKGDLVVRR
jgi:siroheme synthase-like protein